MHLIRMEDASDDLTMAQFAYSHYKKRLMTTNVNDRPIEHREATGEFRFPSVGLTDEYCRGTNLLNDCPTPTWPRLCRE